MKVLAATLWTTPEDAATTFIPEDVVPSLDAYKAGVEVEGAPVTFRLFDIQSDNPLEALWQASQQLQPLMERERNLAILYHWNASFLLRLKHSGVLAQTKPSPLTVEEMEPILFQLCRHPEYNHQTFVTIAENGEVLKVKDGKRIGDTSDAAL